MSPEAHSPLVHILRATGLLAALAMSAGNAFAGAVYKWVDEQGVVHYSDQKPQGVSSEELGIRAAPRPSGQSASEPSRLEEQVRKLEEQEELKRLREQQTSEDAAEQERRKARCGQARQNLEVLTNSARIKTDASEGEPRFLTPEEILEQRKVAQEIIDRECQ